MNNKLNNYECELSKSGSIAQLVIYTCTALAESPVYTLHSTQTDYPNSVQIKRKTWSRDLIGAFLTVSGPDKALLLAGECCVILLLLYEISTVCLLFRHEQANL